MNIDNDPVMKSLMADVERFWKKTPSDRIHPENAGSLITGISAPVPAKDQLEKEFEALINDLRYGPRGPQAPHL